MKAELPPVSEQESLVEQADHRLRTFVNGHFPKEQDDHKAFRNMVKTLLPLMRQTPASGTVKYHSAWAGGLLVHTVEVIEMGIQVADTVGPGVIKHEKMDDFMRSVVKCCYLHDIGKVGDGETPYYLPQDNDWRRTNLGETYTINRDLDAMAFLPIPLRGLWLAQKFNVFLTQDEMQAVTASDGPGSELGKAINTFFETPLTMVVHFADKWVSLVRKV